MCCLSSADKLVAFTTHHFYRASFMPDEPRFALPFLSTLKARIAGGRTATSFDACGCRTNLWAIDPIIAHNLQCAGLKTDLMGRFELFEADFNFYQNLGSGFFLEFYLPVRQIEFFAAPPVLGSTALPIIPHKAVPYQHTGLADCVLLGGFTYNYQELSYFDFLDASIQTGILFPTGKIKSPARIFDFSYGYGGHYGVPLVIDTSLGVYDWVTFGLHVDSVFLLNKTSRKTSQPIRVSSENKWGNITCGATYLKADHIFRGLSFGLGFSHVRKSDSQVTCDPQDLALLSWSMTNFNFFLEFDMSEQDACIGPRLAFIYNTPLRGKRIFRTSMRGAEATLDIAWAF
jgi:hypothetical protein